MRCAYIVLPGTCYILPVPCSPCGCEVNRRERGIEVRSSQSKS